ncbi:MAG: tetraacyldisaccharide 4'-kinase [Proteobacteria bacterium]|nr:tetraacyldisaccharide 4'-kinase [Pseudomonadota bacterium]
MTGAWWLTAPLRLGTKLARASRGPVPTLPRPTLSVGSLALGGRAKTPMTAHLAREALRLGLRPAVLSRGYAGGVGEGSEPAVAVGEPWAGASWLAPVASRAPELGDEPAWLAAVLPGVPVAVHPRRERAAAAVLAQGDVDLFLLDGGFQTPVARDFDLVLLDATADPPFARRAAVREGGDALARADLWGVLGAEGGELPEHAFSITREFDSLVDLGTGLPVDPSEVGPVTVAAGVGDPASVLALARSAGLVVGEVLALRDHHAPSDHQRCDAGGPWLITEKDAVGWGAASPPAPGAVVLVQRLRLDDQGRLASALEAAVQKRRVPPSTNASSASI